MMRKGVVEKEILLKSCHLYFQPDLVIWIKQMVVHG